MKTRDSVLREIHLVHSAVQQWRLADTPNVLWQGQTRKAISTELQQAFDRIIAFARQNDFIESARELILAIDDFELALEAWLEKATRDPANTSPSGSAEMWSAWERVYQLRERSGGFPLPEPIDQLLQRDKVPLQQIAKIYGFTTPDGQADLAKLNEEVAKPGTHFDPVTWEHPSRRRIAEEVARRWEQRTGTVSPRGKLHEVLPQVAVESIENLLRQGVDFKQIARMKRISLADVEQAATLLGIRAPKERTIYPAHPTVAHFERMQEEATRQADYQAQLSTAPPEVDSAEAERMIREYGNLGLEPQEIQQALANLQPNLSQKEIQAALYPEPPTPRTASQNTSRKAKSTGSA